MASGNLLDSTGSSAQRWPREVGWGSGWEVQEEGIYVYIWLTHFVVHQKLIQHCKAIILQFKIF